MLKRRRLVGPENNFGEQFLRKYKKETNVDLQITTKKAIIETRGSFL
jgi:hypothetical protein